MKLSWTGGGYFSILGTQTDIRELFGAIIECKNNIDRIKDLTLREKYALNDFAQQIIKEIDNSHSVDVKRERYET